MAYTDPRARRSSDGQRTKCGIINCGYIFPCQVPPPGGMRPTSLCGVAKAASRQPTLYCVGQQLSQLLQIFTGSPPTIGGLPKKFLHFNKYVVVKVFIRQPKQHFVGQ